VDIIHFSHSNDGWAGWFGKCVIHLVDIDGYRNDDLFLRLRGCNDSENWFWFGFWFWFWFWFWFGFWFWLYNSRLIELRKIGFDGWFFKFFV
jgi:hypothetical protein